MAGPINAPSGAMRKKIVHTIDTPYSSVEWPVISPDDQDAILELLCSFLSPLGHHRQSCQPSKGKRAKKRKRDEASSKDSAPPVGADEKPPAPELASYVDVGLSSISKHMEHVSSESSGDSLEGPSGQPYDVVFVARSGQPPAFNGHFPQMIAVASHACRDGASEATRLVGYSKACAERLSASLGVPRVSSVAVRRGAPGSKPLVNFVKGHVPLVRVSWLEEAASATYRKTNIVSEEKQVAVK